ncbi:MAG: penicillin-binding protein, partial [Prevotella sp.]|nr:penicillin-binding protein [Prevotella sp.]
ITCRGKQLSAGDRVSIEELLVLQVGDGRRDLNDSVAYIDPVYEPDEDEGNAEEQTPQNSEEDDFEVVTGPED